MKHCEIERRYLLPPCKAKRLLKKLHLPYTELPLMQFYLPSDEGSLRYRQAGTRYIRTFKTGEGMVRTEVEEEVSEAAFRDAYRQHKGNPVEKVRYRFRLEGRLYELDEFKGALKGLVMLETEFDDPDEAERFTLPEALKPLVLDEVTENRNFTNHALAMQGLPTCPRPLDELLEEARKATEADPYNASVGLQFHPFEESLHLLQATLYALWLTLRANREAILSGDPDPERLHQLRVALRKVRSVLSFYEKILGRKSVASLRQRLSALMKATNDARDLDVFLLWLDHDELERFPKRLRSALDLLRQEIISHREKAHRALKELLRSQKLDETLKALEHFATDESLVEHSPRLPAILTARRFLLSQAKRLQERSRKLRNDAPAWAYHKARIETKKLRYMLELFASILEPGAYDKTLKSLKKIQKVLGEHQDLMVQIAYLKRLKEEPTLNDREREAVNDFRRRFSRLAQKRRREFRRKRQRIRKIEKSLERAICRI